jgi:outer membrane receptor for ferrienterochelin and colicins
MRATTFFLALCLVASTVGSATVVRADAAEEARFHDELARRHYAARRYEQAIREFFLERDLAPNPRITFNLALCFDALHRDADAYLLFSEYLAGSDDDAERHALAEAALARLSPRVALVSITSDPVGATVYLDRREHGSYGVTPLVIAVSEGAHTLLLERDGYLGTELAMRAALGEREELSATLARIEGAIALESPADAQIEVRDPSGVTVGVGTAPVRIALPPGSYEVEVRAPGSAPWRTLTRITRDETVELSPEFALLPVPTSELTVTASAAGATIEIDDQISGFTPTVLDGLSLGVHRVRVSHPGLAPWQGEVTLGADVRHWLTVSLAPPTETRRSDVTWVVGGAAVASLVVGITLGGLALDASSRFAALEVEGRMYALGLGPPPMGSLLDARAQGVTLASGADVAFVASGALAAIAVILFFATESSAARDSTADLAESGLAEGERGDAEGERGDAEAAP